MTPEDAARLDELMQKIDAAVLPLLREFGMVRIGSEVSIDTSYGVIVPYHSYMVSFRKAESEVMP